MSHSTAYLIIPTLDEAPVLSAVEKAAVAHVCRSEAAAAEAKQLWLEDCARVRWLLANADRDIAPLPAMEVARPVP